MKHTPRFLIALSFAASLTACSSIASVDRSKIHDPLFDIPDAAAAGATGSAGAGGASASEDAGAADDAGPSDSDGG
jgi:hypothetical protein